MILLDTHAWLWWAGDRAKLPVRVRRKLERESDLGISAISCWEVGMLVERGRLRLRPDVRTGIQTALTVAHLRVVPVTDAIATEAGLLGPAFHGDPADRLIAATALELDLLLVTKDERLRGFERIRTLW